MKHSACLPLCLGILLTTLFPSCVRDDEEEPPAELVVEGWIEEGGYPVVQLGETRSVDQGMQDINDYVVRWGKVTISDGENSVILTGGYDEDYFPPYKYTSYNMVGKAGKTYTLTAEYRGRKVTAVTTIPHRVQLDSLHVVRSESDTLFYVKAFFRDPPEEKNRYGLFSKRAGKDKAFLLSPLGVFSDAVVSSSVSADVYCGTSVYTETDRHASRYFKKGDLVQVKLCHMDEASYRFWRSYSNLLQLSSNMFFPYTQDLESNIRGGKGYWCGYGTHTLSVRIR